MLRPGPPRARAHRRAHISAWPAASRSTASPTAAAARGHLRRHLDPAGGRRRRRRAGRRAARRATRTSTCRARAEPDGRDRQQGSYLGPAFSSAEVRAFLDRQGYPLRGDRGPTERVRAHRRRRSADGQGRRLPVGRMEFGPRALGARSILGDPRSADTQALDEPEDQVPRVVPPLRAVGAGEERAASTSSSRARARTCCWWRPVREERRRAIDRSGYERRRRPAARSCTSRAVGHPGDHPRRLQRARPDRRRRDRHPDYHAADQRTSRS